MKKLRFLLCLLLASGALLAAPAAFAQEAEDLTLKCDITVSSKLWTAPRLSDRDWDSYWNGEDGGGKSVRISSPAPVYGLYLCWMEEPRAWTLETKTKGVWDKKDMEPSPFQHQYIPLDGAREIVLKPQGGNRKWFGFSELFVLGEGEVPGYVQQWKAPDGECDLMVFFAHPDDESLFFGGTIPEYAGERGLDVVAACFSNANRTRTSELLNSLWTMGMTNYPVFGPFHDSFSKRLATAYKEFNEQKVKRYAVELFRQYRPRVVVTHDLNGEYGHGMHMMCADAALYAFDLAADAGKYGQSAELYGAWQVSKLYLHLYPENEIEMDWDRPLVAFRGRSGFEMAQEGYLRHQTQQRLEQFRPEPRDSAYSSYRFGLAKTAVGPDTRKNDLMENIPLDAFLVKEP